MTVRLAESAGFCFGVKRAVSICEKAAGDFGHCVTLGPVIHNAHVIHRLTQMGVSVVSDISEVSEETTVIIRSHGAGRKEYEKLRVIGANVVDATCPKVSNIHKIVGEESARGRLPVIIGDRDHPEVAAISDWCDKNEIFETAESLSDWLNSCNNGKKPLSFVFQTTSSENEINSCIEIIKKECTNYNVFDTMCQATRKRQQEAMELAKRSDVMIVVGDKTSANSRRLTDICKDNCRRVCFISDARELSGADIRVTDAVGITAGASTPAWIIKEVTQKMSEDFNLSDADIKPFIDEESTQNEEIPVRDSENPEDAGEVTPSADLSEAEQTVLEEGDISGTEMAARGCAEDADADAGDSAGAYASNESFEEMLEKSIKTLHTGQKVSGVVTSITATEVSVDLGTKQSGYIPVSDFTDEVNTNINDIIKIGDTIESFVMRVNDVEGMVTLSKKRLDAIKNWDEIEAARANRSIVQGTVAEENKGGIVVNVKGIRVFIPASQTGLPKSAPMADLVRKTVRLIITEVNQSRRRVVGSIRALQMEERRERMGKLWEEIENGKTYDGVVKSMTSYGVFVDIGGVDGMIHISELSWSRIKQPSEVLAVGDEVSVYVLSFDKENKKISLGYKKQENNPWAIFTEKHSVGDTVSVRVVKLMPFGAFAEIIPGVDGLIHISQISDRRIGTPSEVLSNGQTVDVKITAIDYDRKKISLSIRAILDPSSVPLGDGDRQPMRVPDEAGSANAVVYTATGAAGDGEPACDTEGSESEAADRAADYQEILD